MELTKPEIEAIMPHIRIAAINFLRLPSPVIANLLYGPQGQLWYDLCIIWTRFVDELEPTGHDGWDSEAGRSFKGLEDRVLFILSFVSEIKPSTPSPNPNMQEVYKGYGYSIVDRLSIDENAISDKLDPDQLDHIQKLWDYKF